MARYRPKGLGLERVLGVGALFSTAYGNVGSSIYYALGLVALFALGMTPVVYLIAGVIFVMTAATYAEASTNFPEAGGSSSFARRAFNEFVSFFAAWGQMLNYIITVSISAFFVPHYLGVFYEPLRNVSRRRDRRHRDRDPALDRQRGRRARVGQAESRAGAGRLRHPAAAAGARHLPGAQLHDPDRQHPSLDGAVVQRLPGRDPGRDDLLHRHRDDLEHGRGGAQPAADDPALDRVRGAGGDGDLLGPALGRAVVDARHPDRPTAATRPRSRQPTPATRSSASSRT